MPDFETIVATVVAYRKAREAHAGAVAARDVTYSMTPKPAAAVHARNAEFRASEAETEAAKIDAATFPQLAAEAAQNARDARAAARDAATEVARSTPE